MFFFLLGCSLGSCQTTPSFAVSSQGWTKQMMKLPEEREGKNVDSKCGLVAARVPQRAGHVTGETVAVSWSGSSVPGQEEASATGNE